MSMFARDYVFSLARDPPNAPKIIFCSPGFVARSPGQFPPIDTASNAPKPMWQPEIMPMRNSFAADPDAFFCPMSTAFWYICGGGFTEGALAAAGTGAAVLPPATTGAAAVDILRLLVLHCCRGAKEVLRKAAADATALEEASGMAPRADRKASDPGARTKAMESIEEKPILKRVVDGPGSLLLCLPPAPPTSYARSNVALSRQLLEPILEPSFNPRGQITAPERQHQPRRASLLLYIFILLNPSRPTAIVSPLLFYCTSHHTR